MFFNLYLRLKEKKGRRYEFSSFLEDFIGFENIREAFLDLNLCCCVPDNMQSLGVRVLGVEQEQSEGFYRDLHSRFMRLIRVPRKWQTFKNDVLACQVLGDVSKHLDANGVFRRHYSLLGILLSTHLDVYTEKNFLMMSGLSILLIVLPNGSL